jgi:hypothetical protein
MIRLIPEALEIGKRVKKFEAEVKVKAKAKDKRQKNEKQ